MCTTNHWKSIWLVVCAVWVSETFKIQSLSSSHSALTFVDQNRDWIACLFATEWYPNRRRAAVFKLYFQCQVLNNPRQSVILFAAPLNCYIVVEDLNSLDTRSPRCRQVGRVGLENLWASVVADRFRKPEAQVRGISRLEFCYLSFWLVLRSFRFQWVSNWAMMDWYHSPIWSSWLVESVCEFWCFDNNLDFSSIYYSTQSTCKSPT